MGNPGLGLSYRLQANYTPRLPQVLCTIHLKPMRALFWTYLFLLAQQIAC